jgi:hypothetical protein
VTTSPEVQYWRRAAQDLGIEIEAPFRLTLPNGEVLCVAALVKHFGSPRGMVVNADYSVISPYTEALKEDGFGYCGNLSVPLASYDRDSLIEVLADWGWSGPLDKRPPWLSR